MDSAGLPEQFGKKQIDGGREELLRAMKGKKSRFETGSCKRHLL